ncbi:MAG: DUF262 domain-containing protein [Leptospiraceae bacterium]|nr:DUF262 domain-containing protein [Leptospiraceae bacterium]MCP5494384.1 DUF262 domain-containing protein [Leptospiraceae bacterium]
MNENEEKDIYDSGIEDEFENEELTEPFNPDEISIDPKAVPMESCLRRLTQKTINLNPDFQRNYVWTDDKKSQLIESLMLKIPLPMFYVSADEKGNWTVVDGLQRLSTIRDFVLGKEFIKTQNLSLKGEGFKLQDLEFWTKYNGYIFNELPINLQNRILETVFNFTVINPGTPEEVKRNIFKRINTGGLPLSSQEIRNALYIGKSTELLNKLAKMREFKNATGDSVKDIRMGDKELILRFISFFLRDYKTYTKTLNIDSFLSETMIIINSYPDFKNKEFNKMVENGKLNKEEIRFEQIDKIESIFKLAMSRSFKLFEEHCFRKSYPEKRKKAPINKSLFEMWSILLTSITEQEFIKIESKKETFLGEYYKLLDNSKFQNYISRDSMKNYAVKERFGKLEELLGKYI